jgi:hypothetical protein
MYRRIHKIREVAASMLFKSFFFLLAVKHQGKPYFSFSLYACAAWSLTVRGEHGSRVYGKGDSTGKE